MLLLRRPALLPRILLPTQAARHQHQFSAPSWSIIRYRSSIKILPTVHRRIERLREIKNVLHVKKYSNAKPPQSLDVPEPTNHQLYAVALYQAIPFLGFGIMDNAILILAGEAIDVYLGAALGISTMCAAAIGNIVSDLCGVAFGTVIEDVLLGWSKKIENVTRGRVKLPPIPRLTHEQLNLRSVRWSNKVGCAVGLTVGCVIGMLPLLFFPNDEKSNKSESENGASVSTKMMQDQNEQLKKEISHWKEKWRVLDREKNDGLWDKGY